MDISREQIIRYFNKECTAAEAAAVADFLKENPGAADEWLTTAEWEQTGTDAGLPDAQWNNIWEGIRPPHKTKVISLVKKLAAAAVLAGAIALAWYQLQPGATQRAERVAFNGKEIINSGTTMMRYVLEDSSVAELNAGSVLRYNPSFPNSRRDIWLTGTAVFFTQGDAARPFSVFNNGLAITALGTAFRISANAATGSTHVLLMEGKVMVAAADTATVKLDKAYYLLPGDEFSYSPEHGMALLRKQPAPARKKIPEGADQSATGVNNWYMFENQGLPQVFEQLAAIYNVHIYYNPADLKGLNFIGRIDQTDTLDNILRDIATLNNLKVMKSGQGFVIKAQ